jgi:hypothetical protein
LSSVLGDTRQRVFLFAECPPDYLSAKRSPASPFVSTFVECTRRHLTKVASLPSVEATSLGKEALPVPRCAFFAECYTRQSDQYIPFYLFLLFHPNKQIISHNHHMYHIYITYLTKTINKTNSHKGLPTCSNTNISIKHSRT